MKSSVEESEELPSAVVSLGMAIQGARRFHGESSDDAICVDAYLGDAASYDFEQGITDDANAEEVHGDILRTALVRRSWPTTSPGCHQLDLAVLRSARMKVGRDAKAIERRSASDSRLHKALAG